MNYFRNAERTAYCRFCNFTIERGHKMFSFYSHHGANGTYVHLHPHCVETIHSIMKETQEKIRNEYPNGV